MSARQSAILVAVLSWLSACAKPKPPVPVVDLRPTGDTVVTTITELPDAAWLGADRWALVDANQRVVSLAEFGSHKLSRLGGPKTDAYHNPFALFRSGDSLWVDDWGMRRATAWTLAGVLAGSVPAADPLRGALPRARDAAGQFYYEIHPLPKADGSGNRDSGAIVRTTPGLTRFDTVAQTSPPDLAPITDQDKTRFERRALSSIDRWGVLPDGTIWLARPGPNRVYWIAPGGKSVRGEALPDPVLPVTAEDREMFFRQFPPELRANAQHVSFAIVKPAFERAVAAPDGTIWLEKSRAYGDTLKQWQLVDRTGALQRVVRVRGDGILIGVTPDLVLLAEPYPDGHRLLTYRIPR
ncbi:MAG: hypothetical protein ABI765_09715 [Gemmatimonadota bacterium]